MAELRPCLGGLLALITAGAMACASGPPPPAFEPFPYANIPKAEDYPVVPAIVLLDRAIVSFSVHNKQGIARVRHYRRLEILREPGLAAAEVVLPYDPGTEISGLIAKVTRPDGTVIEMQRSLVRDVEHESGTRARVFEAEGATVGSVIEYTYDLIVSDARFLRPWHFRQTLPTLRSELVAIVPPDLSIDYRSTDMGQPVERPPERFEVPEGTRLSWTMTKLPAMFPEPRMPTQDALSPTVHLVFTRAEIPGYDDPEGFGSWSAFKDWYMLEHPSWSRLTPAQADQARGVAGESGLEEKALKLLELVARDLAWDPGPDVPLWRASAPAAEIVLNMKHGNRTSRGLLLTALLRAAGIEALPAFVAYRDRGVLFPDLPTVHTIDGVVAVVPRPNGMLVLDPSQLTVSAVVPSPRLQDTRIVLLRDDIAEIQRVPISLPKDSASEVEYDLQVDRKGMLAGKIEARLTGAEAGLLRADLLTAEPSAYPELVSRFLASRGAPLPLDNVVLSDLQELRRPLTVKGTVAERSVFAEASDTTAAIDLSVLLSAPDTASRERRRFPLLEDAPHQTSVRARLFLPEDHEIDFAPPPIRAEWDGGFTAIEARIESRRRLGLSRTSEHRKIEIPVEEYPRYRAYQEEIRAATRAQVTVRRPPPKTTEY